MQQPSVYNLGSMAYMYQDVASSPSPGGVNSLELTLARRPTQWGEFAASNGLALDIGEEYTRELMESLRTDSHRSGGNPFPSTPSYVLRRWAQAVKDELRLRSIVTASTDDSTAPKIMAQLETSGGPAPQKHQVYAGCPFNEGCTTPIDTFTLKGLRAHQRTYHADPNFTTCRWTVGHRYCSKMFTTTGGLIKHIGQVHLRCKAVKCPTCGETLARSDALARHRKGTCTASVPGPSGGTHING
ncbi:hypothetical protein C8Q72DRAFT_278707 [Fomitopsis betulina]|nr:hypothetical protein C8Q72DRAFT_278707 [Fomitopsis betulina]